MDGTKGKKIRLAGEMRQMHGEFGHYAAVWIISLISYL